MKNEMHYDIIADIHGRFDKFEALMGRLGYEKSGDGFVPPANHKALFLGDLIDTKPGYEYPGGVRATLQAVKVMCDRDDAISIMGNHEWNAILYHTRGSDGQWLKNHGDRNKRTHQGTLNDFPDHKDPDSEWRKVWLPWIKALPVALDLGGFRAVHASWNDEMLEILKGKSQEDDDFLQLCANKSTLENKAMDWLLKGLEIPLPLGHSFSDHTGTERFKIRARWWEAPNDSITCSDLVFPVNKQIKPVPVTDEARAMFRPYPHDERPVFFGHFFKPADSRFQPERHNIACLDYSAGIDGPLTHGKKWYSPASIVAGKPPANN
jgi:hypothetical protein